MPQEHSQANHRNGLSYNDVIDWRNIMTKNPLILYALGVALLLAACAPSAAAPTQPDPNAIFTQAAQTAFANVTLTALVTTPTPEPTATPTFTPIPQNQPTAAIPTAATTPLVLPTLGGVPGVQPTASGPLCDDAVYVDDVTVADYSQVSPGQTINKIWRVKNTGVCTWDEGYGVRYGWGDPPELTTLWGGATGWLTSGTVAPGQTLDIGVTLTAPTKPGTYIGYFRMINDNNYYFGGTLSIIIVVK